MILRDTASPLVERSTLPGAPGSLFDSAYRQGYKAGLGRGMAESKVDAALLDAYQRELADVHRELAIERGRVSQLRNVLRSRS